MKYDVIVVGGGIAGLTSAAFLCKQGYQVLLCEKEDHVGGLVSSFTYDGFLFDAGVRGIVDSGIVKPMLQQLAIDLELVKSIVTIGIEDEMIRVETKDSLKDYRKMLVTLYPESEKDIDRILIEINKVMDYMDILYGIENPLFKDLKNDRTYVFQTLLPWMVRFLSKAGKIKKFQIPVDDYLHQISNNQSLIDIISQHFFQQTPASFALSYFSLYLDYEYPKKGTIELAHRMRDYILQHGGIIQVSSKIMEVDIDAQRITDQHHQSHEYQQLIWAADTNQLYQAINFSTVKSPDIRQAIEKQKQRLLGKKGGDSIFSLFLAVDLEQSFFRDRSSGHCFYTPNKSGQSAIFAKLPAIRQSTDQDTIFQWMKDYLTYTTYEIAIPSLRNEELAPVGKTGLVVSVLMDYDFIHHIQQLGFYDAFKHYVEDTMIDVLNQSIYQGIKDHIIHRFSSTPLTIERLSGNHEGGITGWAFTNNEIPAVNRMTKVAKSCLTPIPSIFQAGQWTYSPSGLPISILTGKIAADKATKVLAKGERK